MRRSKSFSILLSLSFAVIACATNSQTQEIQIKGTINNDFQVQSPDSTVQSFSAVQGADLMAKLDAARSKAQGRPSPFWSAYAFDVRPGVAVDPAIREFNGSINTIGETSVFVGTTSNGLPVETRNLAIFLLREPASNQITRMEVFNLERKREYSGYPVYWLGRANNEESLNYLRALAAAAPLDRLSERAVLGIALHDDQRVGGMLRNFITTSQNPRIRSTATYWLGQVGGEQAFLATLVRDEAEDKKIRRQAAHSIGESKDRGALATLQNLYETVKDLEVKHSVVSATGNLNEDPAAFTFLLGISRNDPDFESRRVAVRQLGHFKRDDAADEIIKIYKSDVNLDVKRSALRALAETKNPRAQPLLLDIARNDTNAELRRAAIRILGERGESAIDDLIKLYDNERTADVRKTTLSSLNQIKNSRVEDKLFEVAKADESLDMRRSAIRFLGERVSKRSFDFLAATAQSTDANADVQVQAVRAISQRRAEESVPILIKIARTHPNQLVRRQAIRSLGESGDPRAVDFFREVLSK
ncbi:MAG TPA: HEAT repeat domain-containing protein [Pyrinomonadaceae bacterium]